MEERENKMKLLLGIAMTISAAFAQPSRHAREPAAPTVTYTWTAPDCTGIADPFAQLASGCSSPKLVVTARSFNPEVTGFYILLSFTLLNEGGYISVISQTVFTKNHDGTFSASYFAGDPTTTVIHAASAVELMTGKLATLR